jgi:D-3-phosphoglycerate dehydrogenase
MSVLAIDPFLSKEQITEGGAIPAASLDELYSSSDYVSVHIPATPQTIKSIGYDLITKMPQGATLVNTARKEVIDEEGLEKALTEREDLKYVTDVAPDNYSALREKFGTRIFATPKKMGAQTGEANINAGLAAARQIVEYFATGSTRFQVNK